MLAAARGRCGCLNATEYRPEYCGPARCRYAPVGGKGKPRHARPGPHRTISRSGSRTETRNVPSTSACLRDEACPRGSGTEVERPDDRRTEAWRRASGTAPCRERRRRRTKGKGLIRPIRHLPKPGPRGPPTRARIARLLPGGGLHRIDHARARLHESARSMRPLPPSRASTPTRCSSVPTDSSTPAPCSLPPLQRATGFRRPMTTVIWSNPAG
jgi:hypothetical protein